MYFATQLCEDEQARRSAEALEIILAVDALRLAHKKYKVRINAAQGAQAMLSAPLGTSAHPPPPPPTAGTTTTAAGSLGQQTLTSASDEGGEWSTCTCTMYVQHLLNTHTHTHMYHINLSLSLSLSRLS